MDISGSIVLACLATAIVLSISVLLFRSQIQEILPRLSSLPPATEIIDLRIYPVKSCRGISLRSARLLKTGLDLDRQWMFVSYPERNFLTIRQNSRMTLIRTSYDAEGDMLIITIPPGPNSVDGSEHTIKVPAHPTLEWLTANTDSVMVQIWSVTTSAFEYLPSITAPLSDFFSGEIRLVYKNPSSPTDPSPRILLGNGAASKIGRTETTAFADTSPVLIGSFSSMSELNSRLQTTGAVSVDESWSIERFRPNIIVKGNDPWAEDRWKSLRISYPSSASSATSVISSSMPLNVEVIARCARCRVPNVDPQTGIQHKRQPWDTIMKYRRIDEGIKFKPCFGMLGVPWDEGEISVGMKVEITEVTDKHKYVSSSVG